MNILVVQKFPVWRDSHLKIEGKALYKLQAIFLEDWLYASSGLNTYSWDPFMNRQYFGKEISSAEGAVQIVASGPSSDDKSIRNTLLAVMGSAKIDLDCYTILYSASRNFNLITFKCNIWHRCTHFISR